MVNRNLLTIPAVSLPCHGKNPTERVNSDVAHKDQTVSRQQNIQEGMEHTEKHQERKGNEIINILCIYHLMPLHILPRTAPIWLNWREIKRG